MAYLASPRSEAVMVLLSIPVPRSDKLSPAQNYIICLVFTTTKWQKKKVESRQAMFRQTKAQQ